MGLSSANDLSGRKPQRIPHPKAKVNTDVQIGYIMCQSVP